MIIEKYLDGEPVNSGGQVRKKMTISLSNPAENKMVPRTLLLILFFVHFNNVIDITKNFTKKESIYTSFP